MKDQTKILKNISLIVMLIILLLSVVPVLPAYAKAKKMTVYNQIIKKKNIAYCCDGYAIYKVNLKTKRVNRLIDYQGAGVGGMRLYKGYIYYLSYTTGSAYYLNRIKNNGKSEKVLATIGDPLGRSFGYAIKGKRIYYNDNIWYEDTDYEEPVSYSIKLNGKSKKRTSIECKCTSKDSNVKGYSVSKKSTKDFDELEGTGHTTTYLQLPGKRKIKLARIKGILLSW